MIWEHILDLFRAKFVPYLFPQQTCSPGCCQFFLLQTGHIAGPPAAVAVQRATVTLVGLANTVVFTSCKKSYVLGTLRTICEQKQLVHLW